MRVCGYMCMLWSLYLGSPGRQRFVVALAYHMFMFLSVLYHIFYLIWVSVDQRDALRGAEGLSSLSIPGLSAARSAPRDIDGLCSLLQMAVVNRRTLPDLLCFCLPTRETALFFVGSVSRAPPPSAHCAGSCSIYFSRSAVRIVSDISRGRNDHPRITLALYQDPR